MSLIIWVVLLSIIALAVAQALKKKGISVPALRYIPLLVLLLVLVASGVRIIQPGHVGVQVLFGRVSAGTLSEGLHLINPFKNIVQMSVRTQEIYEKADVPSKEGLAVHLEISILLRVEADKAAEIFKTIGRNYQEVVVAPQIRSVVRGVSVRHEAKDLYTSGREVIAIQIQKELEGILKARGVILENVLLRKIELPQRVTAAINEKLAAEQEAERMKFVLLKETQEAQRKKIEAEGIQNFQSIVARGISQQLLEWKGIEATEKLATSNNSKVVVIGAGKSGLPVILNMDK